MAARSSGPLSRAASWSERPATTAWATLRVSHCPGPATMRRSASRVESSAPRTRRARAARYAGSCPSAGSRRSASLTPGSSVRTTRSGKPSSQTVHHSGAGPGPVHGGSRAEASAWWIRRIDRRVRPPVEGDAVESEHQGSLPRHRSPHRLELAEGEAQGEGAGPAQLGELLGEAPRAPIDLTGHPLRQRAELRIEAGHLHQEAFEVGVECGRGTEDLWAEQLGVRREQGLAGARHLLGAGRCPHRLPGVQERRNDVDLFDGAAGYGGRTVGTAGQQREQGRRDGPTWGREVDLHASAA